MSYVVNNHLNYLYVLSNRAVGPGKKYKINKRRAYVYSGLLSMTGIQSEKFIPSISFQGMAVRIIFRFFEKAIMDSIYPLVVTEAVAGAACRHPFAAQWV